MPSTEQPHVECRSEPFERLLDVIAQAVIEEFLGELEMENNEDEHK